MEDKLLVYEENKKDPMLGPIYFYPLRHFIDVLVENNGKEVAIDCEVKLRILESVNHCNILSPEEKALTWENGETKITLAAKYGKSSFQLAFSQERLTEEQTKNLDLHYCGIVNDKVKHHAWVGTKQALENPEYRDQDGLCEGKFKVHVEVFTITGHRISKHFILTKEGDWRSLYAIMEECNCNPKSLRQRIYGKLY